MTMFHKRPFRCRSCRRRFYSHEDERPDMGTDQGADQPANRRV